MPEEQERNDAILRMIRANKNIKIDSAIRAVEASLGQSIFSFPFLLTLLATTVVLAIGVFSELFTAFQSKELLSSQFHITILLKAIHSDAFLFALPILCTIPFSTVFLEDLKSGFLKEYLPRTTRGDYLAGRIAGCMVSGGFGITGGIGLAFYISYLVFSPMEKALEEGDGYGLLMGEFWNKLLLIFVIGAFWALMGMFMSVVTDSKYMAYTAPFIIYYVLVILCERYMRSCYVLYPKKWLYPEYFPGGELGVLCFLGELSCLLILVFVITAGEKISSL